MKTRSLFRAAAGVQAVGSIVGPGRPIDPHVADAALQSAPRLGIQMNWPSNVPAGERAPASTRPEHPPAAEAEASQRVCRSTRSPVGQLRRRQHRRAPDDAPARQHVPGRQSRGRAQGPRERRQASLSRPHKVHVSTGEPDFPALQRTGARASGRFVSCPTCLAVSGFCVLPRQVLRVSRRFFRLLRFC